LNFDFLLKNMVAVKLNREQGRVDGEGEGRRERGR
jgi:hypothetical protein